jgi:hypothetical protein
VLVPFVSGRQRPVWRELAKCMPRQNAVRPHSASLELLNDPRAGPHTDAARLRGRACPTLEPTCGAQPVTPDAPLVGGLVGRPAARLLIEQSIRSARPPSASPSGSEPWVRCHSATPASPLFGSRGQTACQIGAPGSETMRSTVPRSLAIVTKLPDGGVKPVPTSVCTPESPQ